ncbi:hypothetical protein [Halobacillus litoralis]|uniref:hypothetical protein n=1 Tax=Halobacillus litoralis TaxID=45668 RepID=UPI001CD7A790|nr:hypothetical protein [Halobacillus litoralis]MCA1021535.1 hypothetical protein [Halobacillus litoralis]
MKEVIDRLVYYITEAYGYDEHKTEKLRHDIECGFNDAVGFYKQSNINAKSKVRCWNELNLKMDAEYGNYSNAEVGRIKKWMSDLEDGVNIRSQNGYRW